MKFFHMPKELNGWSDRVLSHQFPTKKSSHAGRPDNEEVVGGTGPNHTYVI